MLLKMNRDHHPSRAANIRGLGTGMLGSTAYAATQLRLIRSNVRGRTRAVVFNCKFIDRVCLPSQAYEAGRRFTIGQTRERGTARSRNAAVPLSLGSTARIAAGAFWILDLDSGFRSRTIGQCRAWCVDIRLLQSRSGGSRCALERRL